MQYACPNIEDYSPCACPYTREQSFILACKTVQPYEIRQTFQLTTPAQFEKVFLFFPMDDNKSIKIPENVFGNHWVTDTIEIRNDHDTKTILDVHSKAFQSSANYTKKLYIFKFDFKDVNFTFLTSFNQLKDLNIFISTNIDLLSLFHQLPKSCSIFGIKKSTMLISNEGKNCSISGESLAVIDLNSNELTDEIVEQTLECVITGDLKNLKVLSVRHNLLTRLPRQLVVANENIQNIYIKFDLSGNKLTKLDSSVFKAVLERTFNFSGAFCLSGSMSTYKQKHLNSINFNYLLLLRPI